MYVTQNMLRATSYLCDSIMENTSTNVPIFSEQTFTFHNVLSNLNHDAIK